jgi:NADH-quinone oxidoreductase subunit J
VRVISTRNPVHAALWLVLSFFTAAGIWLLLQAEFLAIVLVLVYVGAVMVLFLFVVMMLNIGEHATEVETTWLHPAVWAWPSALATVLILELVYVANQAAGPAGPMHVVTPKEIGISLFGPYAIGVELASLLLTSGLVGAYHLGRRAHYREEERYGADSDARRVVSGDDVVRAGSDRSSHAA